MTPDSLKDPALDATIYLVRHGERIDQVDPSWVIDAKNPYDPPLTDQGLKQAQRSGEFIASDLARSQHSTSNTHRKIIVLSSPFYRTLQTATSIISGLGNSTAEKPLLELFPPLSEWLASAYFPTAIPHDPFTYANRAGEFAFLNPSKTEFPAPLPPYPETKEEMRARFLAAVRLAVGEHYTPGCVLILVSHGAGCQALPEEMARAGALHPTDLSLPRTAYCSVTKMVKQKGERVWTAPIVATVEHLGELLEDSGLDFVVGYKDAKNPAAEAQIAKETAQRQPSPSSATIPAAGGDTTAAQIKKYESFVNDRLRVDLQNTLDARDKVYETISEYLKLRNQIELLQTQNLTSLKTMMDVGCEFFMQATIPRLDQITVKIGLDVHVVLTLPEGLMFIARKEQALVKVADRYTSRAADLKAQIKMVLGAIEALLEVG